MWKKMARNLIRMFCVGVAIGICVSAKSMKGPHGDFVSDLLGISKVFDEVPSEGITLLSSDRGEGFLVDGQTDEISFSFVFFPKQSAIPVRYSLSFPCESKLVPSDDSCSIRSALTDIVGVDEQAFNVTVSCTFSRFPGESQCKLKATVIESTESRSGLTSKRVSTRQVQTYESENVTVNVYGVVFYVLDDGDPISETTTIVSGEQNSFVLDKFDRDVPFVREVGVYAAGTLEDDDSVESLIDYIAAATLRIVASDQIISYDTSICSLTDASVTNGKIELLDGERCGIGFAKSDVDGTVILGVQVRAYKAGNFTLGMEWDSFGPRSGDYAQTVTFSILEEAPPVIVALQKEDIYRSRPCGLELLELTAYNVRLADSKEIVVRNSDKSETVWPESTERFMYDAASDKSTVVFENAGGLGTNSTFTLVALFGDEKRQALVLDTSLALSLSFTKPPVLESIDPAKVSPDGGEQVSAAGSFENFDEEGRVFVGGYIVPPRSVTLISSSRLTFYAPPFASLGKSYEYDVTVRVCAERSTPKRLTYQLPPVVKIIAVNSSSDESGAYIVSSSSGTSFLAQVSGNNNELQYSWELFGSDGGQVSLPEETSSAALFVVNFGFVATGGTYQLLCRVKNSLGFSDTEEITLVIAVANVEYLTVNVYKISNLTRSTDVVTLVQASIQYISTSGELIALASSDVTLRWVFGDNGYAMSDSPVNKSVTGPTQLGLEFNIARRDLSIGRTQLSLEAALADKPTVKGADATDILVIASKLLPRINGGLNGTLVISGEDLVLSGTNSSDPDILQGEGDPTEGLGYQWMSCEKSLTPTFSTDFEDCSSLLPADKSLPTILVDKDDLLSARMDNGSDPDPTYLLFGLTVNKGNRSALTYSFFEFRTVEALEPIPYLDSLDVVDTKGTPLQEYSILTDIIIQPTSETPDVLWAFDMSLQSQRFLFATRGVIKSGFGFETKRGNPTRRSLGFNAGSLEPSTQYTVKLTVTASETALESEYEISFTTSELPALTCNTPLGTSGVVSQTRFTISGQLSFVTQNIEYCFYLISDAGVRYIVGKGCSPVPFAEFAFPLTGIYAIECVAKSFGGSVIDNITLSTPLVLSTPLPDPTSSETEILANRLGSLEREVSDCEGFRDHACVRNLISAAAPFTVEVSRRLEGDTSEEAQNLFDACKTYVARLSRLSNTLAEKTVYRPNQVIASIETVFSTAQIPAEFISDDETLFGFLRAAEQAANATAADSSEAVIGNDVVDKASGMANLTLSTAFNIAQRGSSRRRLLQDADEIRRSFGIVITSVGAIIGKLRSQQETCGYSGTESTVFPEDLEGEGASIQSDGVDIPPLEINIKVSCTQSQITSGLRGSKVRLDVCPEALSATEIRRTVISVVGIPDLAVNAAGFLTNVDSYVEQLAYFELSGRFPPDCYQVVMKRKPESLDTTAYDRLVGGILRNVPTSMNACSSENCYTFEIEASTGTGTIFSDDDVIVKASESGLYVAGNFSGRAIAPDRSETLSGKWTGVGAQALVAIGIFLAFIVVMILFSIMVAGAGSVAQSPERLGGRLGEQGLGWEFVERDRFGRDSKRTLDGDISASMSRLIPEGARPPAAYLNNGDT